MDALQTATAVTLHTAQATRRAAYATLDTMGCAASRLRALSTATAPSKRTAFPTAAAANATRATMEPRVSHVRPCCDMILECDIYLQTLVSPTATAATRHTASRTAAALSATLDTSARHVSHVCIFVWLEFIA